MIVEFEQHAERIDAALHRSADSVKQTSTGRWDCVLRNGAVCTGAAWIEDGWFAVRADAEGSDAAVVDGGAMWRRLTDDAHLEGGAKFALRPGCREVRVHVDIPLTGQADRLIERIDRACRGVKGAFARLAGTATDETPRVCGEFETAAVKAWCEEAGWIASERSSGDLAVGLDVPGRSDQAVIAAAGDSELRLETLLVDYREMSPITRRALGLMLLTAADAVRLARPVGFESDDLAAVGFIADVDQAANVGELHEALSALSVACRICGNEIEAVADDETTAQQYLSARGWASREKSSPRRATGTKGRKSPCRTKTPSPYACKT